MNYRLLIDYEVIEFLEALSRREQRLLRNRFVAIRDDPQKFSDYTEPDHTDRRVDIHICGRYAVKFWQDHADRHIKFSTCIWPTMRAAEMKFARVTREEINGKLRQLGARIQRVEEK